MKKLNNRGQGLVEYLVIVALMAVATMAIMRTMNTTVTSQFAKITQILAGRQANIQIESIDKENYSKKDMSDFFHGAQRRDD
jgi:Flp pilus assembly pilin Flp